jgi:hypothetical protein
MGWKSILYQCRVKPQSPMQFNNQTASYTTQSTIAPAPSDMLATQSVTPANFVGGLTIFMVLALMIASGFSAGGLFVKRLKLETAHS